MIKISHSFIVITDSFRRSAVHWSVYSTEGDVRVAITCFFQGWSCHV